MRTPYLLSALSFLNLVKNRFLKRSVPLFTALGVTSRCNYRCVYCYGNYFEQNPENFSTEELLEIIDTLKKMGTCVVNLIGGEPLIRNDIDRLIDRVVGNRMICNISTNASLLPEKIHLVKNVHAIDTSLDGLEENNDKNRGAGTFQKTLDGILCAIQNNLKVNVNMVLTRHNVGDVDEMVALARNLGFSLSFNIVFESHSSEHGNYQDSISIKSQDDLLIKNTLDKIVSLKKGGAPIRFSPQSYRYAMEWPKSYSGKVFISKSDCPAGFTPIKCYFPQFHCYIDVDGRMYNCMHIKDHIPVVNIKETGVERAWEMISSQKTPCVGCYTICNNDANLIFGLKPGTLFNTFKDTAESLFK